MEVCLCPESQSSFLATAAMHPAVTRCSQARRPQAWGAKGSRAHSARHRPGVPKGQELKVPGTGLGCKGSRGGTGLGCQRVASQRPCSCVHIAHLTTTAFALLLLFMPTQGARPVRMRASYQLLHPMPAPCPISQRKILMHKASMRHQALALVHCYLIPYIGMSRDSCDSDGPNIRCARAQSVCCFDGLQHLQWAVALIRCLRGKQRATGGWKKCWIMHITDALAPLRAQGCPPYIE
eukprot:scaffold150997_cov20-Tisochrysis_lutea.AAC.1